jgi:hypothetical protein
VDWQRVEGNFGFRKPVRPFSNKRQDLGTLANSHPFTTRLSSFFTAQDLGWISVLVRFAGIWNKPRSISILEGVAFEQFRSHRRGK